MVKKILIFLGYCIFFILAIIIFTPKSSLYFLMEKNLKQYDVIVSKESLHDKAFSLHIENLEISTKGITSANVKEADITFLIFFNSLRFYDIELSSLVDSFVPAKIDSIEITYMLFNPLIVSADGIGKFGNVQASFNILKRELKVVLEPSKKMLKQYQNSLKMFTKDDQGEYVYVKTF